MGHCLVGGMKRHHTDGPVKCMHYCMYCLAVDNFKADTHSAATCRCKRSAATMTPTQPQHAPPHFNIRIIRPAGHKTLSSHNISSGPTGPSPAFTAGPNSFKKGIVGTGGLPLPVHVHIATESKHPGPRSPPLEVVSTSDVMPSESNQHGTAQR